MHILNRFTCLGTHSALGMFLKISTTRGCHLRQLPLGCSNRNTLLIAATTSSRRHDLKRWMKGPGKQSKTSHRFCRKHMFVGMAIYLGGQLLIRSTALVWWWLKPLHSNFLLGESGKSFKFWIKNCKNISWDIQAHTVKEMDLKLRTCVIAKPWDLEHSWFPRLTDSYSCIPKGFHGVRWCVPLFIEQKLRQSRPMSMKAFPHLQQRTVTNASLSWATVWGYLLFYIVAQLLPRISVWFLLSSIFLQTKKS